MKIAEYDAKIKECQEAIPLLREKRSAKWQEESEIHDKIRQTYSIKSLHEINNLLRSASRKMYDLHTEWYCCNEDGDRDFRDGPCPELKDFLNEQISALEPISEALADKASSIHNDILNELYGSKFAAIEKDIQDIEAQIKENQDKIKELKGQRLWDSEDLPVNPELLAEISKYLGECDPTDFEVVNEDCIRILVIKPFKIVKDAVGDECGMYSKDDDRILDELYEIGEKVVDDLNEKFKGKIEFECDTVYGKDLDEEGDTDGDIYENDVEVSGYAHIYINL